MFTDSEIEQTARAIGRGGPEADRLVVEALGLETGNGSVVPPFTRDADLALTLLPANTLFHCGRAEDGRLYWCDVGFRPKVQAWGETLAAAIAAAIVSYRLHSTADIRQQRRSR